MKKYLISLLIIGLLIPLSLFAQDNGGTQWDAVAIIALVILVVETIVARLIPTKYSGLVGLAVDILKRISDYLNRDK